ncbi:MAG: lipoprotein insertase outer membrane protein LolB [Firmicutes bacterium]|nr:lipoprotein insertase outer membrane protein LolB [Bacillota bacterium]
MTVSSHHPIQSKKEPWDDRVTALSRLTTWNVNALIAIQNYTPPAQNITATLQWQQTNQHYTILIFGPLGSGTAKLIGGPGQVSLITPDGKVHTAHSPEELLTRETHWRLPVSHLYYWIRGLPVPNLPADKQLDQYNHLIQLSQQGWVVQYLDYTSHHALDLPDRISLSNPALHVKIVIKQWNE